MESEEIKKIAIIGAGLMEHGIALEFAKAGYSVKMHDTCTENLENAMQNIRANMQMITNMGLINKENVSAIANNIETSLDITETVNDVDLVIESVFEDLELKKDVFRKIDKLCPKRTILASNTSTLLPSLLGEVTKRADKTVVMHFFNPPYLLPLVEIVRGKKTSDKTVNTIHALLSKMGKSPAIVKKEAPGFIGNRL